MTDDLGLSAENLRLHLGEMTPREVEVARAAIHYFRTAAGVDEMAAALRPFSRLADHYAGPDESDADSICPTIGEYRSASAALAIHDGLMGTSPEKSEAMERDHRAIHRLMELLLAEVKLIRGNGVTANNIGYLASQAKEWSGRYCEGEKTAS